MGSRTITASYSAPMEDTRRPPTHRLLVVSSFAMVSAALSVFAVLLYKKRYVNADTLMQSIQSVQHVDLFFWGQNRFASAIPLLASILRADSEGGLRASRRVAA